MFGQGGPPSGAVHLRFLRRVCRFPAPSGWSAAQPAAQWDEFAPQAARQARYFLISDSGGLDADEGGVFGTGGGGGFFCSAGGDGFFGTAGGLGVREALGSCAPGG